MTSAKSLLPALGSRATRSWQSKDCAQEQPSLPHPLPAFRIFERVRTEAAYRGSQICVELCPLPVARLESECLAVQLLWQYRRLHDHTYARSEKRVLFQRGNCSVTQAVGPFCPNPPKSTLNHRQGSPKLSSPTDSIHHTFRTIRLTGTLNCATSNFPPLTPLMGRAPATSGHRKKRDKYACTQATDKRTLEDQISNFGLRTSRERILAARMPVGAPPGGKRSPHSGVELEQREHVRWRATQHACELHCLAKTLEPTHA